MQLFFLIDFRSLLTSSSNELQSPLIENLNILTINSSWRHSDNRNDVTPEAKWRRSARSLLWRHKVLQSGRNFYTNSHCYLNRKKKRILFKDPNFFYCTTLQVINKFTLMTTAELVKIIKLILANSRFQTENSSYIKARYTF